MRQALILLLFCSVIFPQYGEPPLSNVTNHNFEVAESLDGSYNASLAQNGTIALAFGSYVQNIPVSASLDIAGLSLMVDNATYPSDDLSIIIARGVSQGHLTTKPYPGCFNFSCDDIWFNDVPMEFPSCCDFESPDGDSCVEYERRTFVIYDINATFSFGGVSETVPMESNVIWLPADVLEAMESASGADTLNVSLDGAIVFVYEINDRGPSIDACSDRLVNRSVSLPISLNRSFRVCGKDKLFFLVAPALREQWFRNNRFDVAVLSQSPLYGARIYQDGNATRNFTLGDFSVVSNGYGIQEIITAPAAPDGWIGNSSFVMTPIPLEAANHSFAYAYRFNYSYQGLGEHNLSLLVKDSFGGSARYDDALNSVMLSHNGSTTENGSPIASQPSRASAPNTPQSLVRLDIGLGIVALLLLLAFVNSWLLK